MNFFADQLFDWFLSATIRGSLLFGAVVLIQLAFRNQLSAFWRHALWLPVIFVLASPILPESPWSLERHFVSEEGANASPMVVSAPFYDSAEMPADRAPAALPIPAGQNMDSAHLLAWVWLIGASVVFIVGYLAHGYVMRKARRQAVPLEPDLNRELHAAARSIHLRRLPELLVSKTTESPAITGLFRPVLLLPADFSRRFAVEERRLILLHELHHFRRGDLPVNALLFLLQAVHWCNPVVWMALNRFRADRELACDSAVLEGREDETRQLYGRALIKLSESPRQLAPGLGFVGMFGHGRELKFRVASIAGHRRRSAWWSAPAMVLITVLMFAGGTKATPEVEAPKQDDTDHSGEQIHIESKFIELDSLGDEITIVAESSTFDRENNVVTFIQDGDDVQSFFPNGNVKILASPRVVTLSGQKAVIHTGESLTSDDDEKEESTSLKLEVVPTIKGGEIELKIKVDTKRKTDPEPGDEIAENAGGEVPTYIVSRFVSDVVLEPGQTVILGGLMQEKVETLVAVTPEIQGSFDDFVIPRLNVQKIKFRELIKLLQEMRGERIDPEDLVGGEGFGIIISGEIDTEKSFTMDAKEVRLSDVLKIITESSGMTYRNVGNLIYIEKAEDSESP